MNTQLKIDFSQVLKKLQELPQMDLSELNSHQLSSNSSKIQEMIKSTLPVRHSQRFLNELFDLGPLQDLIHQPDITEIIVNGQDHICYEAKAELHILPDSFLSALTFGNFIHRLCEEAGIVLTLDQPFGDSHWRGWRVHLARQPVVNVSFHLSLRKHPDNPWTLEKLKNQDWAPEPAIQLIKKLIKNRKNILIAGPTSSGKTSVLNSCLQSLPKNERVITIEDSSELLLPNTFSTKLLTRQKENIRFIDQQELVRQSLRMRPDRIIMGETRGYEAKDLLLALATGHSGSLGTIHASDHRQALWRLEMLVQMGAPSWSTGTIQQMIVLSISHLLILGRYKGDRKLMGIYKLAGVEKTGYLFEALFICKTDSQFQELFPLRDGGSG